MDGHILSIPNKTQTINAYGKRWTNEMVSIRLNVMSKRHFPGFATINKRFVYRVRDWIDSKSMLTPQGICNQHQKV